MIGWLIAGGVILLLWTLATLKTSRPDGVLLARVHPYRRALGFIMPTRNESVVYFDEYVVVDELLAYMERARERFDVDITHCVVAAAFRGYPKAPKMNQFVSGRRLYQRKETAVTFSMKRKAKDKRAKLSAVKLSPIEGETFRGFCERVNGKINVERSGKKTYQDKEFDLLTLLPRPVFRFGVGFLRMLDYYNLLPASFIHADAMYTSIFIANLGSVGMRAGYHHLYEWGTCPLFVMLGRIEERPMVEDGQVVARKVLHIRFTYDERIDDGFTAGHGIRSFIESLLHPFENFGCLAEDGSDAWPLADFHAKEADWSSMTTEARDRAESDDAPAATSD